MSGWSSSAIASSASIVAELLWRRFPDEAEGEMTRRHTILCGARRCRSGAAAGLGARLIVSKGEEGAGVREDNRACSPMSARR